MNKVDRIFSEKLTDHSVAPSGSAWDRIEAGLAKKNNAMPWMRWAAVMIPAAVMGLLYFGKPETATNTLTKTQAPDQSTVPVAVPKEIAPVVQVAKAPGREKRNPAAKQKQADQQTPLPVHEEQELMISQVEPVGPVEEIAIEPTPEPVVQITEEVKPLVLVYTLESIPPSSELEKKPTSLERVVEIAKTVKHSDPLGDLRMMKDELLAIDLRKKSTKKN